jgi:O-antigen/teichoic acid export membrane protein
MPLKNFFSNKLFNLASLIKLFTIEKFYTNKDIDLYRNTFFIATYRIINISVGFLFWTIAARSYSIESVGIATALISSVDLVVNFSRLGFDVSLTRFMHLDNKIAVFNTTLWITSIWSLILSVFYISFINIFLPSVSLSGILTFIFIVICVLDSMTLTISNTLLVLGKGEYILLQRFMSAFKIPVLIPLTFFGIMGIFLSSAISDIIIFILSLYLISKFILIRPIIEKDFIKKSFKLSSLNYLANVVESAMPLAMPPLILSIFGAEKSALFYMAFTIASLVYMLPEAISRSFFIEGSKGNKEAGAISTLLRTYLLMIPAAAFMLAFPDLILGWFGPQYVQASGLLRVLVISNVFAVAPLMFISVQNIRMQSESVLLMSIIKVVLLFILTYIFIHALGFIGLGLAWMTTFGIMSIISLALAKKEGWI